MNNSNDVLLMFDHLHTEICAYDEIWNLKLQWFETLEKYGNQYARG